MIASTTSDVFADTNGYYTAVFGMYTYSCVLSLRHALMLALLSVPMALEPSY
jgi:hypothetical protein